MSNDEKTINVSITGAKVLVVIIIAALWGASLWLTWRKAQTKFASQYKAEEGSQYPLLNPRLRNLEKEERLKRVFPTLIPLRDKLFDFLGDKKDKTAFYIEDLNGGAWTGWQEKEEFIPASLLKVPVAIGVMKKIDDGDWTLGTAFEMQGKFRDNSFGDLWRDPDGEKITVEDLVRIMLQNSDNTATNMLFENLTVRERDDIYYHIGIQNPEIQEGGSQDFAGFQKLTARNLATIFRALWNATYLSRESSNYILDTLTRTDFKNLISRDIPDSVKVAHKMGEILEKPGTPNNFHDCGIAFVPTHPYLYCIMTKDLGPDDAGKIISGLGGKIYDHFSSGGNN